MGGTSYSHDDYASRTAARAATGTPTFAYDAKIRSGAIKSGTHASLDPKGIKVREARDSDTHPISIPIIIQLDTTGSMATVPSIIQAALPKLMGSFLDDKVSGKKYLGDGYPAILISANDDWEAQHSRGGVYQMGQFESGLEIDDNLTNLYLTGNGGGGIPRESYQLGMYAAARYTAHDHWDKRKKKGYMFIIGDEMSYSKVRVAEVKDIFGVDVDKDIPLQQIVQEVNERYHLFFIIPRMTSHFGEKQIRDYWAPIVGERFVELEDPSKICQLIVSLVAMTEGADLDDLIADGVATGLDKALTVVSKSSAAVVGTSSIPHIAGDAGSVKRL